MLWFFASSPTIVEVPSNKTVDGVVFFPSPLGITTGCPSSLIYAIHENVVPKSIPIYFPISHTPFKIVVLLSISKNLFTY